MPSIGNFFKESIKEFEHVVWPTPNETKRYFRFVLAMIVAFGIFIFILGTVFVQGIFGARNLTQPKDTSNVTLPTTSPEVTVTPEATAKPSPTPSEAEKTPNPSNDKK